MEASAGMVAGSYKRNELVRIRHDSDSGVCIFIHSHLGFQSRITITNFFFKVMFFSLLEL